MAIDALRQEAEGTRQQFQDMKFDHAVSPLQNPNELKKTRRDLARLLTELRARELASMKEAGTLRKRDKIQARRRKK